MTEELLTREVGGSTVVEGTESLYRKAERELGRDPDAFWEYLERHKHDDRTLCIGWAIKRAERYLNRDQATVAQHTAVVDRTGRVLEEPISKSFVSAMLSGRSKVTPQVYVRLAEACEVSELEFYIAEGWTQPASIAAYNTPERAMAQPILARLAALRPDQQPSAVAVVLGVLDSVHSLGTRPEPEAPAVAASTDRPLRRPGRQPKKDAA
jgi:hypothetical protein